MKDWINKFLKIPYDKRGKVTLGKEGYQKRYNKERRKTKSFSKEDVLAFLSKNYVFTKERLKHINDIDIDTPSVYYVLKWFETWENMLEEVYGFHKKTDKEDERILGLLVTFNIKSQREYQKRRNLEPRIFPSMHFVIKQFGSWQNLKRVSQGMIVNGIIERYIVLKIQKKRWPKKKECEAHGIEIERVLKHMSQDDLKELISILEVKVKQK